MTMLAAREPTAEERIQQMIAQAANIPRFHCDPYNCSMTTDACAKRWRSARANRKRAKRAAVDKRTACFGCPVGARHAGASEEDEQAPEPPGAEDVRKALHALRVASPIQVLRFIQYAGRAGAGGRVGEGAIGVASPLIHRMQVWRVLQRMIARGEAGQDTTRLDMVRVAGSTGGPIPHPALGDSAERRWVLLNCLSRTGFLTTALAALMLCSHGIESTPEDARKALRQLYADNQVGRAEWEVAGRAVWLSMTAPVPSMARARPACSARVECAGRRTAIWETRGVYASPMTPAAGEPTGDRWRAWTPSAP